MVYAFLTREETIENIMQTLTLNHHKKFEVVNEFNNKSNSHYPSSDYDYVMAVFKEYENEPLFSKKLKYDDKFKSLIHQYVANLDDLTSEFEEKKKEIFETGMGSIELEYFYHINNIECLKLRYLEKLF